MASRGVRDKKNKMVYGAVCLDWKKQPVYTSFSTDLQELITLAETTGYGIIYIERAYSQEPPVWTRDETE